MPPQCCWGPGVMLMAAAAAAVVAAGVPEADLAQQAAVQQLQAGQRHQAACAHDAAVRIVASWQGNHMGSCSQ